MQMTRVRRPDAAAIVFIAAGVAAMAASTVVAGGPFWAVVVALVALTCWLGALVLARLGAVRSWTVAAWTAVVLGGIAAPSVGGSVVAAVALALVMLAGDPDRPVLVGVASFVAAAGALGVGLALAQASVIAGVAMLAGLALGFLGGLNRRAVRGAQRSAAAAAEQAIAAREAAERIAIARDLHDVLAHTLGGLAVQLDAADAQLEAGQAAAAAVRIRDARALVGDGLAEARRAVAALRSPAQDRGAPDVDPSTSVGELVATHRRLGGAIETTTLGVPRLMPSAVADVVVRVVQEALSNVRRHAPGTTASVVTTWQDHAVTLVVSNPLVDRESSPGGGFGIVGMRERAAALPLGGAVVADADGATFTVRLEAALP